VILGPGRRAHRASPRVILSLLRGELPALPPGGLGYVDVRDTAEAAVVALERGGRGERYILNHHNLAHQALVDAVERLFGAKRPRQVPRSLVRGGAAAARLLVRVGPRWLERTTLGELRSWALAATLYGYFDPTRARQELDFQFRPLEETLIDTVSSFIERGKIDPSRLQGSGVLAQG
jgi:dihydroflavonol-4-reductase